MTHAFDWEKISLFAQLRLYFHCAKKRENEKEFAKRLNRELKRWATT